MNTNKVKEICPCCGQIAEVYSSAAANRPNFTVFTNLEIKFILTAFKRKSKDFTTRIFTIQDLEKFPVQDIIDFLNNYKTQTIGGDAVKGFIISKLQKQL